MKLLILWAIVGLLALSSVSANDAEGSSLVAKPVAEEVATKPEAEAKEDTDGEDTDLEALGDALAKALGMRYDFDPAYGFYPEEDEESDLFDEDELYDPLKKKVKVKPSKPAKVDKKKKKEALKLLIAKLKKYQKLKKTKKPSDEEYDDVCSDDSTADGYIPESDEYGMEDPIMHYGGYPYLPRRIKIAIRIMDSVNDCMMKKMMKVPKVRKIIIKFYAKLKALIKKKVIIIKKKY